MTELRLDGKVALITGGSKGIGLGIAREMSESGARVMISSRKPEGLEAATATIPGEAAWFAANAGDPAGAEACVAATIARFGRLDILVNNAATNPYIGPLMGIDLPRAEKTLAVNLIGPLVWTQHAWRAWMEQHGGIVINVSSIGGLSAGGGSIPFYGVTKAALIHMTKQLANELAPGVRVNALVPGVVKTDFSRVLWEDEQAAAATLPMQRLAEPADIAPMAVFLASDAASWITGGLFVVDGGAMVGGSRNE